MIKPEPSLLLLIPAYNEEDRIEPVLVEFAQYFQTHYTGKFHLVVVLNGCRDNTMGVVQRVVKSFPAVSALEFAEPIGKGGALIEGLKLAPLADLIGYVDADGATGPKAFHELVRLHDRADCIIGSRWLPGSVLHQRQTRLRRFVSRCFSFDCAIAALAEHQGHTMSRQAYKPAGRGKNSRKPHERRPRV